MTLTVILHYDLDPTSRFLQVEDLWMSLSKEQVNSAGGLVPVDGAGYAIPNLHMNLAPVDGTGSGVGYNARLRVSTGHIA